MSSPVFNQEMLRFGRLLHYAGLAVVLVVGAATYNWFYQPVETDILDAEMKIEELATARQNSAAIRQKYASLSDQLRNIQARYAALERRVPLSAEAGNFLKHVSEIASEEKLVISNFQPAQSLPGDGFTAMEVMLDGKGTFKSICAFFDKLSKIQRLSKVIDLSLVAEPQSDDYPMKATIVIYFGLQDEDSDSASEEVRRG
jgi:type IV pilus assembly protein PilO